MEHTLSVKTSGGKEATLVLDQKGRRFAVVDFKMADADHYWFGFTPGSSGVENLDETSDIQQCFGISSKIRYGDVVLGNSEMKASSIEELTQALNCVKIRVYNPEEI